MNEIIKFSFYVFLGMLVVKVFWSTDQVILGAFVSSTAVSICSLVSQIAQYYSSLSETITKPYLTLITKNITLVKKEKIDFTEIFIKVGRVQTYLLTLIITGFLIFGKKFVVLWAGESFIQVYELTLLILIPLTVPAVQNVGVAILQALNIHKFRSIVYFIIAVINVFISIVLVKKCGIYGTTFGTVSAIVIGHIVIMNIYYKKKLGLNLRKFWKNVMSIILKALPLVVIFYIIEFNIKKTGWITLALEISIYTLLYGIILYKFIITSEEKNRMKEIIGRKKINESN